MASFAGRGLVSETLQLSGDGISLTFDILLEEGQGDGQKIDDSSSDDEEKAAKKANKLQQASQPGASGITKKIVEVIKEHPPN